MKNPKIEDTVRCTERSFKAYGVVGVVTKLHQIDTPCPACSISVTPGERELYVFFNELEIIRGKDD